MKPRVCVVLIGNHSFGQLLDRPIARSFALSFFSSFLSVDSRSFTKPVIHGIRARAERRRPAPGLAKTAGSLRYFPLHNAIKQLFNAAGRNNAARLSAKGGGKGRERENGKNSVLSRVSTTARKRAGNALAGDSTFSTRSLLLPTAIINKIDGNRQNRAHSWFS